MFDRRDLAETDPFLSSFLEAPETKSRHAVDTAGRSIQLESRISVMFRHSGWHEDRMRIAKSLVRTDQPDHRREAFADCGLQAFVLRSIDDPTRYRVAGSCCHDRFCLPCATERSCIIAGNVLDLAKDRELRFLTLTLKSNETTLKKQLDKLYVSFQALRRRAFWKRAVSGGVAFLELKRSRSTDRWHPHLHCLLEGTWIGHTDIRRAWYFITGDSFIIDIRPIHDNQHATRYVTKYASKPFNSSFVKRPDLLDEALVALRNRKLAVTFGRWRGLLLTATPDEGAWEHVASLSDVIQRAASGDDACISILASLTDKDMAPIYARAPPWEQTVPKPPRRIDQLDFFGVWQADGSFRYRMD